MRASLARMGLREVAPRVNPALPKQFEGGFSRWVNGKGHRKRWPSSRNIGWCCGVYFVIGMVRFWKLAAMLLLLVLADSCARRSTPPEVLNVRSDNTLTRDQRYANLARMREFLWMNWRQQRPAILNFSSVSKEGKLYETMFELTNINGTQVVLISHTEHRTGYAGQDILHPSAREQAFGIRRIAVDEATAPYCDARAESRKRTISAQEDIAASRYCLEFVGWNDWVISDF